MNLIKGKATHSRFVKGGVLCSADSLILSEGLVLHIKPESFRNAKNPRFHKSPIRWWSLKYYTNNKKMKIIKTTLPNNSLLNTADKKYGYVDSFQGVLNDDENKFTSADIGKAFFSSGPKWVGILFTLRNKIVSIFGLKTSGDNSNREKQLENFKCEPGEQLGLFKVFAKTENEVILGEDDKHLNFRVSLFLNL